ncbi:hypothetical protein V5O48_010092 [Marasmius crinis-equi]|uniref:Uncharacterized protein n=1 Tax=Marasmius crinis-equi TaxID=585013 RepID=A0ABR3F991_9AGAR
MILYCLFLYRIFLDLIRPLFVIGHGTAGGSSFVGGWEAVNRVATEPQPIHHGWGDPGAPQTWGNSTDGLWHSHDGSESPVNGESHENVTINDTQDASDMEDSELRSDMEESQLPENTGGDGFSSQTGCKRKRSRSTSFSSTGMEQDWTEERADTAMAWGLGFPWRTGFRATAAQVLKYLRKDFGRLNWSWHGVPGRDVSLDGLPDKQWATTQLWRCLPLSRKHQTPPPTFTGAQVQSRIAQIKAQLDAIETTLQGHKDRTYELNRQRVDLEGQINTNKEEAKEIRSKSNDLENRQRELASVLLDLNDLELVGLAWVRQDDLESNAVL